jgi:AcrR family transcriptional regulator
MARIPEPPASERLPLNRDRVLRAAIRLADREGIEGLSMRKLGQALGVEAMSLYNHVANKDDLVSGMFDTVMREIAMPSGDTDWKSSIRAAAISAHDVLQRHTWAGNLVMSPAATSLTRLRWMDAILGVLRQSGFSVELTHHAWHALDSHIVGFTLWVASLPATGDELLALASEFITKIPIDDLPHFAEHVEYHIHPPESATEGDGEFAFGLDLILDGLERLRDSS